MRTIRFDREHIILSLLHLLSFIETRNGVELEPEVLVVPVDPLPALPLAEATLDFSQSEALFLQAPDALAASDHIGGIELIAGGGDVGHFE